MRSNWKSKLTIDSRRPRQFSGNQQTKPVLAHFPPRCNIQYQSFVPAIPFHRKRNPTIVVEEHTKFPSSQEKQKQKHCSSAPMSLAPEWDNAQFQPVTIVLRSIIRDYEAGGGILLELCQNADDAGASKIEFVLDRTQYTKTNLLHAELAGYQGAALLAYNNRPFEEKDFRSLRRIGDSGKADDLESTGKFGKGFNSVNIPSLFIVLSFSLSLSSSKTNSIIVSYIIGIQLDRLTVHPFWHFPAYP